jgi:hypothetical protein
MQWLGLLSRLLKLISLMAIGFCLLSIWLFYEFYVKWLSVFEDGRYFDPATGVVFHDTSFVWGVFSLASLLTSATLWLISGKIKVRSRGRG